MGYQPIGDLKSAAEATIAVADDPHLSEVACQVLRLSAIQKGAKLGPTCPRIPLNRSPGKGIGLRHAVGPIRLAVKVREKPWVAVLAVGSTVALVFALGYGAGRRKRA